MDATWYVAGVDDDVFVVPDGFSRLKPFAASQSSLMTNFMEILMKAIIAILMLFVTSVAFAECDHSYGKEKEQCLEYYRNKRADQEGAQRVIDNMKEAERRRDQVQQEERWRQEVRGR